MATTVVDWPFPQLLTGDQYDYLALHFTTDSTLRLFEITSGWDLAMVATLPISTYGAVNKPFSLVSVGPYTLLANERVLVWRDPTIPAVPTPATPFAYTAYSVSAPYAKIPVVRSLCNFKGQLVGCGVQSAWYDCDDASIVWGDIGSESMTPTKRNEAGFRRFPRGGTAQVVKRLGDVVVGYSDREIVALVPKSDPAPTFGLEELLPLGLAGPTAVGGTKHEHVFIDKAGWLWKLAEGPKLERLGYQEFMLILDPTRVVITFDETEQDYYISDGNTCYLLSQSGLTEVHEQISAVGVVHGERVGYGKSNQDESFDVVIDTLDFGMRGLKTLSTVEAGLSGGGLVQQCVHWKTERNREFLQTPWKEVNGQGAVACETAGSDFRVQLRAPHYEGISLDYLKLRWKMTDLRTLRGVYAPPTSARGQR